MSKSGEFHGDDDDDRWTDRRLLYPCACMRGNKASRDSKVHATSLLLFKQWYFSEKWCSKDCVCMRVCVSKHASVFV